MFAPLLITLSLMSSPAQNEGAQTDAPPPPPSVVVTPEVIAAARAKLDSDLVNYPASRFKDVRAISWTGSWVAGQPPVTVLVFCGQLNTENRMGGMTGWSSFSVRPSAERMAVMIKEKGSASVLCTQGTPIDDVDYSAALSSE